MPAPTVPQSAYGSKIGYGATPTFVAHVKKISGFAPKADTQDTTDNDSPSGWRQFTPTLKDGGEVSIEGWLINGAAANRALVLAKLGTTDDWTIQWPDGTKVVMKGIVTSVDAGTGDVGDICPFAFTLKLSGAPTFTEAA